MTTTSSKRCCSQIESAPPIVPQEGGKAVVSFGLRRAAPIMFRPLERGVLTNDLEGLIEAVPQERGAQDRVAGDEVCPGIPEPGNVELTLQLRDDLIDDSGSAIV